MFLIRMYGRCLSTAGHCLTKHSDWAIQGVYCLLRFEHWNCSFEFLSGHGCIAT